MLCWQVEDWDSGDCGTTNITVPWATGEPTRRGRQCGRMGFEPKACIWTGVWTNAEMIPVCPVTGNTWQSTGGLDMGNWGMADCDVGIAMPMEWGEVDVLCTSAVSHGLVQLCSSAVRLAIVSVCCREISEEHGFSSPVVWDGTLWSTDLSAVCRITLVALRSEGCSVGGAGLSRSVVLGCKLTWHAALLVKAEHSLGCCLRPEQATEVLRTAVPEVSAKLGLWGGVMHCWREEMCIELWELPLIDYTTSIQMFGPILSLDELTLIAKSHSQLDFGQSELTNFTEIQISVMSTDSDFLAAD